MLCSPSSNTSPPTPPPPPSLPAQEPSWNLAAEDQAADRCFRLGQTKDVRIFRYQSQSLFVRTTNTIEQPILELQDGKHALGQGAMRTLNKAERELARLAKIKLMFDL